MSSMLDSVLGFLRNTQSKASQALAPKEANGTFLAPQMLRSGTYDIKKGVKNADATYSYSFMRVRHIKNNTATRGGNQLIVK